MYYDVVKSTYNSQLTTRIDSELISGGYDNEDEATTKAASLIIGNTLGEDEFYEVEEHSDNGDLLTIIEL